MIHVKARSGKTCANLSMADSLFAFANRADAGRQLADKLAAMALERPVVYALPRGGVPVATVIAERLHAPLDLILVRKIGAPGNPEVALGAVVEGATPETVINEDVMRLSGADGAYLERARAEQLAELERRRSRYMGNRARITPKGRTAIVVDDGLATGATMRAALIALKRQGAEKIVLALPVAPRDALAVVAAQADSVVCLNPVQHFRGVGSFYRDFHQLTDEETTGLLRQAWAAHDAAQGPDPAAPLAREVTIPPLGLVGDLVIPPDPRGIIVFAHGSGSSRHSPRNKFVATRLNETGFATLLLDLLTPEEEKDRQNVFDIALLAQRVIEASAWISSEPGLAELPLGLFGASTGAAAALVAASELKGRVSAVVSRGGRPDLAGRHLSDVEAPTLLIVGGEDHQVIDLNRQAHDALSGEKLLQIIPGAGHLFEEPGTLEAAIDLARAWFEHYLIPPEPVLPHAPEATTAAKVAAAPKTVAELLQQAAEPLPPLDDPAFGEAFDRFASKRVVLLGEASHGTSEFYRARAAITRRLIEKHGFTIVAVEADWPDAAAIDRDIRRAPNRPGQHSVFQRFPTWMWRNTDVDAFVRFLRDHNAAKPPEERVGFFGLDLYNMNASIAAVVSYLDRVDRQAAAIARQRYACLSPWSREPAAYGRASLSEGYALCENAVVKTLVELLEKELEYIRNDGDAFFDASQNARLVADAERYYRVMYYGSHESWNLRDRHMFDTLKSILNHAGADKKAVVWAHNSHIGDARFTDMGQERGELNIGQLCRQEFGTDAALIGFGTDRGTVAAASDWDGPMEIKTVRPARPDSYEALLHNVGQERFLLHMHGAEKAALRQALVTARLERYIGVIYRPETERWSHYSYATLPGQYDAFVWFDKTEAVTPLPGPATQAEDETYPFGL